MHLNPYINVFKLFIYFFCFTVNIAVSVTDVLYLLSVTCVCYNRVIYLIVKIFF